MNYLILIFHNIAMELGILQESQQLNVSKMAFYGRLGMAASMVKQKIISLLRQEALIMEIHGLTQLRQ